MDKANQIYRYLIKQWLHSVQIDHVQHIKCLQYFIRNFYALTKLEISYDAAISNIIIENLQDISLQVNMQNLTVAERRDLNVLIYISKILYEHLLINLSDVRQIMEHVPLTLGQVQCFINSNFSTLEERWERFIPYEMDVFWFIVPFKGIDISKLIQLYQKTAKCKCLKDNTIIADYYLSLKHQNQMKSAKSQLISLPCMSSYQNGQDISLIRNQMNSEQMQVEASTVSWKSEYELFVG